MSLNGSGSSRTRTNRAASSPKGSQGSSFTEEVGLWSQSGRPLTGPPKPLDAGRRRRRCVRGSLDDGGHGGIEACVVVLQFVGHGGEGERQHLGRDTSRRRSARAPVRSSQMRWSATASTTASRSVARQCGGLELSAAAQARLAAIGHLDHAAGRGRCCRAVAVGLLTTKTSPISGCRRLAAWMPSPSPAPAGRPWCRPERRPRPPDCPTPTVSMARRHPGLHHPDRLSGGSGDTAE